MNQRVIPVILSGGSGTRLWPLSRELRPKQLLPLVGQRTMLQETLLRLASLGDVLSPPIVICNEQHRFLVAAQLQELDAHPRAIVLEPAGRNTAPAVAIAALLAVDAAEAGEDVLLLVLPADHVIQNEEAFSAAARSALEAASEGYLVTFGVVPTRPETGYGYIRRGGAPGSGSGSPGRESDSPGPRSGSPGQGISGPAAAPSATARGTWDLIDKFVEKPDLATAKRYVDSGEYFWNSGMFVFSAAHYLHELERQAPQMLAATRRALAESETDRDFVRLGAAFVNCPADSIDYAVMENAAKAAVVPLDAGWNDVGSWLALHDVLEKDAAGNVLRGDVLIESCRNSYIESSHRLVAAIGLDGFVIVETGDAVLIVPRDAAQDVKLVVDALKRAGRPETRDV